MKQSKLLTMIFSALTALFILTAAIALPILVRPFYALHIKPLGLEEYTGLSRAEILTAYDEMMDFCMGWSEEFSVGVLGWSRSGASHFADVRHLFRLDLWVLGLSLAGMTAVLLFCRHKKLRPHRFLGRGPGFWAAAGLGTAFLTVGGLAALDFDRAFVLFHALFFPGKDNWIFDWREDPIILFLPQDFFRNCAILILALLLVWCGALILSDLLMGRRGRRPDCPPACEGCPGCGK